MESWGLVLPKFMKFLTKDETNSDEMRFPMEIVRKYGDRLGVCFMLKFRNGYELPVVYNEVRGTIRGVLTLYQDFGMNGGEMLVFEYNGVSDLNVHVIGKDLREIDYPNIVHVWQKKAPRTVSVRNGDMKFVNFITDDDLLSDEFEAPLSFKRAFPQLPGYQNYVFSNGKKIEARYHHGSGKFQGLSKFLSILGKPDFSEYNLILFSYEVGGLINISVFDDNFVEVMFPGTPMSSGLNSHNPTVHGRIEIIVKPSHMYKYSYGVDISVEYASVTNFWRRRDYITVYSEDRAWKLQVRSRCNCHRTAIKDGWIDFRDDLGLQAGDVVVLECAENSGEHFTVSVVKNQTTDGSSGE